MKVLHRRYLFVDSVSFGYCLFFSFESEQVRNSFADSFKFSIVHTDQIMTKLLGNVTLAAKDSTRDHREQTVTGDHVRTTRREACFLVVSAGASDDDAPSR